MVEAPHLQELAKDLPEIAMSSKATSTTAKYVRAFYSWKRWASQFPEVQLSLHHHYTLVCIYMN